MLVCAGFVAVLVVECGCLVVDVWAGIADAAVVWPVVEAVVEAVAEVAARLAFHSRKVDGSEEVEEERGEGAGFADAEEGLSCSSCFTRLSIFCRAGVCRWLLLGAVVVCSISVSASEALASAVAGSNVLR